MLASRQSSAMRTAVLVTDLDNTLYNWKDFYAPSFRAMVHALSRELSLDENSLLDDFKRTYSDVESLEYSWSAQALPAVARLPESERQRLVHIAMVAFGRAARRNLSLYDGVRETLAWASSVGLVIVGLTNSPVGLAEWRLGQLGVGRYFYNLAGWEGPDALSTATLGAASVARRRPRWGIRRVPWGLAQSELKPSPLGLERIVKELEVCPSEVCVIGDSLRKDVAVALKVGAIGVWARYGRACKPRNLDTLRRITHWSEEGQTQEPAVQPTFVVDSFSELRAVIEPPQMRLPGLSRVPGSAP